jgi:hypothetical protein
MLACVCIGLVLIVVVGFGGAANCGPVGVSVLPNAATADHTLPRRIISSSSSQPTIFRSSRAARRLRRQSLIMSPGRPPTPVMSPSAYTRLDLRRRNLHKCRQQPSDDHRHTAPTGRQHVYRHRIVDLQMKEDASGKRHTNTWLKAKCCKIRETSGSNSAVECDLAKVEVAGSNPVSRSRIQGKPRRVVVQFGKGANQTRGYCVARSDASRGSPRYFALQRTLAQDDNQTAPLSALATFFA